MTELNARPLEGRLALVTGASRGIGYAAALAIAKAGAHVIAVARTTGGLEELDDQIQAAGGQATLVPLDLKDEAGIDRLGGAIHERWGKLDILVANAGQLGTVSPLSHVTAKAWTEALSINVTANWRLIRSTEPLLRLSDAGRAIFVTSGAARRATAYWGVYAATKAAMESLALTWANELAETGNVKVNLLSPGPVRTAMRARAFPGEDPESLPAPNLLGPLFVKLASPGFMGTGETHRFELPDL
ncbi:SDR family NAD(P)-dependent oxidoreductase [Zavarzinia sp. CC-PAN008]|uniref:SDR family NAD(P)-dependent oxidoreductase n=1 Tax=Zavarzinia sp. CC-PAN008 TaxID=3243332 RepID=UPI003F7488F6